MKIPRNGVKTILRIGTNGEWVTSHIRTPITEDCRTFSEARSKELLRIEKTLRWYQRNGTIGSTELCK